MIVSTAMQRWISEKKVSGSTEERFGVRARRKGSVSVERRDRGGKSRGVLFPAVGPFCT